MVYLEIAVNIPQVSGVFHYHLPAELQGQVEPGCLVMVPFGGQTAQGVVLRQVEVPQVEETRPVLEVVDGQAVLTSQQIKLAEYMSASFLTPLAACIDVMIPPGLRQHADVLYTLNSHRPEVDEKFMETLSLVQKRLLALLQKRGALRGQQIDRALPRQNWRHAVRSLQGQGFVTSRSILPEVSIHPKTIRTVQLAVPPEIAKTSIDELGKSGSRARERRTAMLRFLIREPDPVNITWLYAESGGTLEDVRFLADLGLVILGESEVWRDPIEQIDIQPYLAPELTHDQQAVWQEVKKALSQGAQGDQPTPILLHGVTGSGKTEIYLQAVQETLKSGRQAIILVPEISLTAQTIRRFAGRFPGQVGLVHSKLSPGERYDTWRRARLGQLGLVVGPRSGLFTPFARLGLIVVDESHDDSYYQTDYLPIYDARQTALAYARLTGALAIFGSATPEIANLYQARQGYWKYLHLPERILAHREVVQSQLESIKLRNPQQSQKASHFTEYEADALASQLPATDLVDMRQELQSGNRSIFSLALQSALSDVLANGLQAILFLNRRGSATYVFCRECGHTLKCPRCEIPLTYHLHDTGGKAVLTCHYCGYRRGMPDKCPQCNSQQIRHYGAGTERVEAEVLRLFPAARTLRWDAETTRQKGAHEIILSHFSARRADVLIGTQMLAKGLDFPLVTLVGVILADVGLSLPDYRAGERTFQLLTQVSGRAGRSPLGGRVILQTFMPDHPAIIAAAHHDYQGFYEGELKQRRLLGYPPYTNLVRLEVGHAQPEQAERAAQAMLARVKSWMNPNEIDNIQIVGPAPCFFSRIAGQYRWQIVLKGQDPISFLRNRPLGEWKVEVNPPNLL